MAPIRAISGNDCRQTRSRLGRVDLVGGGALSAICLSPGLNIEGTMPVPLPRTTSDAHLYYNHPTTSVRLDPELEARLDRAAALRGESKSDFIRAAVADRISATLGTSLVDRLAHVIGQVDLGGGLAARAHELAGELMDEDHRAEVERWRPRS